MLKPRCGRTQALATDVTSPNTQPERTADRSAAPNRAAPPHYIALTRMKEGNFLFIHGELSPEVANLEQDP